MRIVVIGVLVIGTLIPAACGEGDSAAEAPESAPGRLVIVGGALSPDNEAVYQAVLDGRLGDGPVCVIPTAGGDPAASMASAVERIDRWGGAATAQGVLVTVDAPERADDAEVAAQLRGCSGFYFTGGSQSRIVAAFRPDGRATLGYEALISRWREGAVVAGSSAGAAMMGGHMISGGASMDAFEVGVGDDPEGVEVTQGMGFFDQGWLDQHFLARGRWGRLLMTALRAPPYAVGYGIDENTALVVDGDRATVVGASGVVVINARNAQGDDVVEGITLELLGAGDAIDLQSLEVTPAAGKLAVEPVPASSAVDLTDPFARWALLTHLAGLSEADGAGARLDYAFGEGWTLELEPASGFRIRRSDPDVEATGPDGPAVGPEGTPLGLGAGPFSVRITVGQPGSPQ